MARLRCRLCGGKLVNNRCTFCGLDNSCYDRDHSYQKAFSEQRRSERRVEQRAASGTQTQTQTRTSAPPQPRPVQKTAPVRNNVVPPRAAAPVKKRSGAARVIIIIAAIFIIVPLFGNIGSALLDNFSSMLSGSTYDDSYSDDYDWDPYEFVTRDIPETGETYETVIGAGIYQIGIHLPEGIYRAELLAGTGSIDITDSENSIYDYTYFGTEDEYDEVTGLDDIRLYNGAELKVDAGVLIRFSTENAQPLTEQPYASEESDAYTLPEGEYTAGTDGCPEGIYDISVDTDPDEPYGYASISLLYPDGLTEYFWADSPESAASIDGYSSAGVRNVVIPDGTEVSVEYGDIILIPGQGCYDVDYDSYPQQ